MQSNSKSHKVSIFISLVLTLAIIATLVVVFIIKKPTSANTGDTSIIEDLSGMNTIGQAEADWAYDETVRKQYEQNPIVGPLPIIEDDYRIDYGECGESGADICIHITADTDKAKTAALNALKSLPEYRSDYVIKYIEN